MKRFPAACFIALASTLISIILACAATTQATDSRKSIRIIYTNDTIGYLEPCGCGGSYQGGFARRATLISRLIKENPNALILDSGNLSDTASKLPLVAKLMADMHYDAVGVGEVDAGFGDDYFKITGACGLKVVETADTSAHKAKPYLITKMDGIRVGVVSFRKAPNGADDRQSLCAAYQQARKRSDILILLDQGGIATREWIEGEAVSLGVPDVVIGGVQNSIMPQEKVIGKTHIVPTSVKGKQVGVIDMEFTRGQPLSLAVRMVTVDKTIPEDQTAKKQISKFLSGPAQSSLGVELGSQVVRVANERTYCDSGTCRACHPNEYEDWRKTNHAKAVQTLKSKDRLIPECLQCHSEEFRQAQKANINVANPAGVECATCHASVLPHGADGPPEPSKRRVDQGVCISCHTSDRSPNYNEHLYLPKVSHPSAAPRM